MTQMHMASFESQSSCTEPASFGTPLLPQLKVGPLIQKLLISPASYTTGLVLQISYTLPWTPDLFILLLNIFHLFIVTSCRETGRTLKQGHFLLHSCSSVYIDQFPKSSHVLELQLCNWDENMDHMLYEVYL